MVARARAQRLASHTNRGGNLKEFSFSGPYVCPLASLPELFHVLLLILGERMRAYIHVLMPPKKQIASYIMHWRDSRAPGPSGRPTTYSCRIQGPQQTAKTKHALVFDFDGSRLLGPLYVCPWTLLRFVHLLTARSWIDDVDVPLGDLPEPSFR